MNARFARGGRRHLHRVLRAIRAGGPCRAWRRRLPGPPTCHSTSRGRARSAGVADSRGRSCPPARRPCSFRCVPSPASHCALSRTEIVTAWLIEMSTGPMGARAEPHDPGRLESEDAAAGRGTRIDPPPSVACAAGTTRAATSAAEPPDEPPVLWSVFHGLRDGPPKRGSVVLVSPNSGVALLPRKTRPDFSSASTGPLAVAGDRPKDREPECVGRPRTSSRSLMNVGTPANGPVSAPRATSRARPKASVTMALIRGSTASARPTAASTASSAVIRPPWIASAVATASSPPAPSGLPPRLEQLAPLQILVHTCFLVPSARQAGPRTSKLALDRNASFTMSWATTPRRSGP